MPGLIASKKYIVIFINICELDFPQQAVALNALDTLRDNNTLYSETPAGRFLKKFRNINRKAPVLEFLFNKVANLQVRSVTSLK